MTNGIIDGTHEQSVLYNVTLRQEQISVCYAILAIQLISLFKFITSEGRKEAGS